VTETINFGDFRRTTPLYRDFGHSRGQPVDRYYIERFLDEHRREIAGSVLEMGDDRYTRQFGDGQVRRSEILDQPREDSHPTIVADLTAADHVPGDQFDCIIFTQTLQYVYDLHAAVRTLHRLLRPRGVLLSSFPVVSQICRFDMDRWGDFWRFTSASARRLLSDAFGGQHVTVHGHGNVLAAVCFLHGLATEDLTAAELDFADADYEIVVTARAVKRPETNEPGPPGNEERTHV
jgi:SAM-dependent methyltransferase